MQMQNLRGRPAGWRPREALQFKCEDSLLTEFSLDQRRSVFSISPSTDWMKLIHIMESNLLYSESPDLCVNPIQKEFLHKTVKFDQIFRYCGLANYLSPSTSY